MGRLYTALERGIHSREWIFASSKSGRNSNKGAHDVCCSRCGHFRADQDLSREKGGMSGFIDATVRLAYLYTAEQQYKRMTKTFGGVQLECCENVGSTLEVLRRYAARSSRVPLQQCAHVMGETQRVVRL